MKKLFVILSLVAFNLNAQDNIITIQSTDKCIAKTIFNEFNLYRNSINLESWNWSDSSYNTSLQWNMYLAKTNQWKHSDAKFCSSEIIVSVTLTKDQPIDYKFIADSCINQIIHSSYHKGGFCAPKRTKKLTTSKILWGSMYIEKVLCDSGAISVVVRNYQSYKIVTIIVHTIATV